MNILDFVLGLIFTLSLLFLEFFILIGIRRSNDDKEMKRILLWSFISIFILILVIIYFLVFPELQTLIGGLSWNL